MEIVVAQGPIASPISLNWIHEPCSPVSGFGLDVPVSATTHGIIVIIMTTTTIIF
jgi:hypothetical protein